MSNSFNPPINSSGPMVSRWTPKQIEAAKSTVNYIHEGDDDCASRDQLMQALAIYADLLADKEEELHSVTHAALMRCLIPVSRTPTKTVAGAALGARQP